MKSCAPFFVATALVLKRINLSWPCIAFRTSNARLRASGAYKLLLAASGFPCAVHT